VQRMHGWVGRKDRHAVEIDAVVHRDDGSKEPVRLSNLSDEGCRIEAERGFTIGERLAIAIPRMGKVKAQVRWALPGSAGARFLAESDF
jgi:PilZ domain-containing protein